MYVDMHFKNELERALNKPAPWYVKMLQRLGFIPIPLKVESPSTQIARHIAMLTIQNMEMPKEYRGLKLTHRHYVDNSILRNRPEEYKWSDYSLTEGKGKHKTEVIIFSSSEQTILYNAKQKAERLKKEHESLTYEAGRQQKAIDILCGTYSKPTTVESLEKSTPDLQITSTKKSEEDWLIHTCLATGGTYRGQSKAVKFKNKEEMLDYYLT